MTGHFFHRDQWHQKTVGPKMAPPPASGKSQPWNSHNRPITDRLTTIINFQYCCISRKCCLLFAENCNSVRKTRIQNTILKVLWLSMWMYVGASVFFGIRAVGQSGPCGCATHSASRRHGCWAHELRFAFSCGMLCAVHHVQWLCCL